EHVVVVRVNAGKRHDDAGAQPFGDTTRALGELILDDVRLLEVGVIGVEDQRLAVEGMPERLAESAIPALSHPAGIVDDERFGRIEVVIEVVRADDLPVKSLVLDFVAPEVLSM